MSYYVYVLQNSSTGKFYIGQTSDVNRRLSEHNDKTQPKKTYTRKQQGTWELIYQHHFTTRSEAMKQEKYYKTGRGRDEIK